MSVADISRIESGRLRPYPSQLEKLAAVLEVNRDELLDEVGGEVSLAKRRVAAAGPMPAV